MPALPYIALAVGVVGAVDQHNQASRVERKQNRLRAVEQAQTSDRAARERRSQIRQQLAAQAQIENAAANAGQSGSSAPIAASAGVQANVNSNIGAINQAVSFGSLKTDLQQDIFNLQQPTNLGTANAVVGKAVNIFQTPKSKV